VELTFEKWHANNNDFIIIWLTTQQIELCLPSIQKQAQTLCSKEGNGIAADGLLVLRTEQPRDLLPSELIIINRDGRLAKNCGNGLRCAAMSIRRRHVEAYGGKKTLDNLVALELIVANETKISQFFVTKEHKTLVQVDLGIPKIDEQCANFSQIKSSLTEFFSKQKDQPHHITGWHYVEIGNPHLVIMLSKWEYKTFLSIAKNLQKLSLWDGVNVHWVDASPRSPTKTEQLSHAPIELIYKTYIWERGVGETKACGSGAGAITFSLLTADTSLKHQPLGISMPGGILYITQDASTNSMLLIGSAQYVFSGKLTL